MNAPWVLDVASNTNRENVDGLRIGNVKRGGAIMITINIAVLPRYYKILFIINKMNKTGPTYKTKHFGFLLEGALWKCKTRLTGLYSSYSYVGDDFFIQKSNLNSKYPEKQCHYRYI
jgi:hypothetical protein